MSSPPSSCFSFLFTIYTGKTQKRFCCWKAAQLEHGGKDWVEGRGCRCLSSGAGRHPAVPLAPSTYSKAAAIWHQVDVTRSGSYEIVKSLTWRHSPAFESQLQCLSLSQALRAWNELRCDIDCHRTQVWSMMAKTVSVLSLSLR